MKLPNMILTALLALTLAACSSPTIPDPDRSADSGMNDSSRGADSRGFGYEDLGPCEHGPFASVNRELTRIPYSDFDQF